MKLFRRQKNYAQRRIALISLLLVLLTAVMVTVFSVIYYDRFTTDSCTENARRFRATLSDTLEYLDLDIYVSDGDDEESKALYNALRDYLKSMCISSGIEYIYLFKASPDDDYMHYIMTAAEM